MKAPADAILRRMARLASREASLSSRGDARTTRATRAAATRSTSASGPAAPSATVSTARSSARAVSRSARACISVASPSVSASSCRAFGTAARKALVSSLIASPKSQKNPVTLPPGRARLRTKPLPIASPSKSMATIGIASVASRAARAAA